jgi:hypothetical protein
MKQEKEVKALKEIKEELSKKEKDSDIIGYLKPFIADKAYSNIRKELLKDYVPALLKKPKSEYMLTYEAMGEGVEPVYFWILDFMADSPPGGLGLDVAKSREEFEASLSSGYFGEMGQRATLMQKQAAEYLGAINQVIKSIIQLIYDLKEFELRIAMYDGIKSENSEIKKGAVYSLKGVWMDQVDMRKGKGSINMMAQDLNFVTLRDAFFHVNSHEEIGKLDLNVRVRNVLTKKWEEYDKWVELSGKEIKNRYNIERAYLKSQIGTLKLYAAWVKPYLLAAQKLKMHDFKSPNIVNAFSNMEMKLGIRGKKEIKPEAVHASFAKSPIKTKFYYLIDVQLHFRTIPSAVEGRGGRHYLHGGKTEIVFKGYSFDDIDIKAIDDQELYDDIELVEEWVGSSLKVIEEEAMHFYEDKKEEEEEKKQKKEKFFAGYDNPFKGIFSGFGEIFRPMRDVIKSTPPEQLISADIKKTADKKAEETCELIYNTYKKVHGMLSK